MWKAFKKALLEEIMFKKKQIVTNFKVFKKVKKYKNFIFFLFLQKSSPSWI